MASITITLAGEKEFVTALDGWSARVEDAFRDLLQETERELVASVKAAYPRGATGKLRGGVRSKADKRSAFLSVQVRSTAPHVHLFEQGTVLRRHRNGKSVGRMPKRTTFIPLAIRYRDRFNALARRALQQPAPAIGSGVPEVVERSGGGVGI